MTTDGSDYGPGRFDEWYDVYDGAGPLRGDGDGGRDHKGDGLGVVDGYIEMPDDADEVEP
jgi:hypothetical protein